MTNISGKVIPIAIEDEVKTAYLNYAMSVIVSRALPDIRDGLKPVHRRLLYSMDELGLRPNSATKKSARIVGDTMGKYHPHGDASLYDALVRMAQDFSLRYPLVQGQGNFGSIDGDPAAASRYTEAKLSRVGDEMLQDLKKETVDFVPNYDESLNEPTVLPAAIPNLLINGSSGIAVGMATNIPPHNLTEVTQAVCALIDYPEMEIDELINIIKGPDFPTGGIIYGKKGIREAYTTGRGKIVVRAKFEIEIAKSGKEFIVFNEIPYNVNKATLIIKIAELVKDKQIDGVSDLRDESDRDGIRIVIELKKGAVAKIILNQLFRHTALQSNFNVNNLALVSGKPKCLSIKEMITSFIDHRIEVVTRRTKFDLRKAEERAHILEGLIIALVNIDEVVALIKASKDIDTAKVRLSEQYALSDIQAQAIVDMRLGRLTSLEVEKIKQDLADIKAQIEYFKSLLEDNLKLRGVIKDELVAITNRYGDARRTEIQNDEIEMIDIEDLIKNEDMIVLISNLGFIKRVPVSAYRSQGRGGKGMSSAKLVEDDYVKQVFIASTHDHIMFISSAGKAYWVKVYEIPEASRTARGSHIKSLITITANEDISAVVAIKEFANSFIFMGTVRGVVKKVQTEGFINAKKRGIIAIKLDQGDALVSALLTDGNDDVVMISRKGQALKIKESTVRASGRSSRGVAGIRLRQDDELISLLRDETDTKMLIISEYGYGKRVDFEEFKVHGRATFGQRIYTISDKTGDIAGCVTIGDQDEIMCITSQGKSIKVSSNEISVLGRSAQGVRILNIERPDLVIGVDKIIKDDEDL